MLPALVSIVGTTTSVRDCAGIPRKKSIRGNGRGATTKVASQFMVATASWLVASNKTIPSITST